MKQAYAFTVDLTKIQGKGDFSCPKCGADISPDDTTEKTYSIIEPKVNNYGLEELVICCNNCSSQIHLTGFSLLEKLSIK
jgi:5-methylcytosine-specific restriction endonuclease McrA